MFQSLQSKAFLKNKVFLKALFVDYFFNHCLNKGRRHCNIRGEILQVDDLKMTFVSSEYVSA